MLLKAILPTTVASYGTREVLDLIAIVACVVGIVMYSRGKWDLKRTLLVSGVSLLSLLYVIPLPEGFDLAHLGG
jgi:hypothetical protein